MKFVGVLINDLVIGALASGILVYGLMLWGGFFLTWHYNARPLTTNDLKFYYEGLFWIFIAISMYRSLPKL